MIDMFDFRMVRSCEECECLQCGESGSVETSFCVKSDLSGEVFCFACLTELFDEDEMFEYRSYFNAFLDELVSSYGVDDGELVTPYGTFEWRSVSGQQSYKHVFSGWFNEQSFSYEYVSDHESGALVDGSVDGDSRVQVESLSELRKKSDTTVSEYKSKSFAVANSTAYLDDLEREVYSVQSKDIRELDVSIKRDLESAFEREDKQEVIRVLIERADKFPINDQYIGWFRDHPNALAENPRQVDRIYESLKDMGIERIIEQSQRKKSSSKQMGSQFEDWVQQLPYMYKSREEFIEYDPSVGEVVIFEGSGVDITVVLNELGCSGFDKNPDFLAKKRVAEGEDQYITAEAKFVSSSGGGQTHQIKDAIKFVEEVNRNSGSNVTPLVIVDGLPLSRHRSSKIQNLIRDAHSNIISALVLEEFLDTWTPYNDTLHMLAG